MPDTRPVLEQGPEADGRHEASPHVVAKEIVIAADRVLTGQQPAADILATGSGKAGKNSWIFRDAADLTLIRAAGGVYDFRNFKQV